jgi:hypothetical protein
MTGAGLLEAATLGLAPVLRMVTLAHGDVALAKHVTGAGQRLACESAGREGHGGGCNFDQTAQLLCSVLCLCDVLCLTRHNTCFICGGMG